MAKIITSYGKYKRAKNYIYSNKNYMRIIRNATSRATLSTVKGIINGSIVGGVSGGFGSVAKTVFVNPKLIDKRLDSDILDDNRVYKIMGKIKVKAQSYAPVDKRYIGNRKGKNFNVRMKLPVFENLEDREKGVEREGSSHGYVRYYNAVSGRNIRQDKEIKVINFLYGGFSIEKQKKIKENFFSGNRNQARNLWFDRSSQSINLYKAKERKNTKIATAFSDSYLHYGEEELRRSGDYDEENHIISFDPTRLGTKYNYAALQHDNLQFKHKEGMALFLYRAYSENRRELIEILNEVAVEKLSSLTSEKKQETKFNIKRDVSSQVKNSKRRTLATATSDLKRTLRNISRIRR